MRLRVGFILTSNRKSGVGKKGVSIVKRKKEILVKWCSEMTDSIFRILFTNVYYAFFWLVFLITDILDVFDKVQIGNFTCCVSQQIWCMFNV